MTPGKKPLCCKLRREELGWERPQDAESRINMHFLWKSLSFRLAAAPGQEAASPRSTAPTPRQESCPGPYLPPPTAHTLGCPLPPMILCSELPIAGSIQAGAERPPVKQGNFNCGLKAMVMQDPWAWQCCVQRVGSFKLLAPKILNSQDFRRSPRRLNSKVFWPQDSIPQDSSHPRVPDT